MPLNYKNARDLLEKTFARAEAVLLDGKEPEVRGEIREACEMLFRSSTQAYREVLLGCTVVRLQDRSVNIRTPYTDQGDNAFSGRTLDEKVINPFLHDKRIPSSKGPYLSVFRRSVRFEESTKSGLRDKKSYDALLVLISYLESLTLDRDINEFLNHLLYKFAEMREASLVQLSRLQRISLEQYGALIDNLLAIPSGGRLPVLLVVAALTTVKEFFAVDWEISWQGINVADSASGAGGDIEIKRGGKTILAAEVTERPVDKARVVSTFTAKIAPAGLEDYLFFVKFPSLDPEARKQAHQYFAQGHEVNFLEIKNWILMVLATTGKKGRELFNQQLVSLLESPDIPRMLKVKWNEQIGKIIETPLSNTHSAL